MDIAFRRAVMQARGQGDLYFASLLPEDRILQAFGKARWFWQSWIYSPAVTIWVFLSQCLSADHSCRDAVSRLIAWRLAKGLGACSAQTGAYCTARERITEEACRQLMQETGRAVDDDAPAEWRWLGRRVLDVDGSTVTMPDTPANQAEYPQQATQKRGCGFPIARIVVVFSLAVGTVLEAAIGKYQGKQTGENSLFRTLHEVLRERDVVLADRYFSGWFDLALLRQRTVDSVVHKHQLRATDFRTGQRLGAHDHLVRWKKPARPAWMSKEQYDSLPDELTLREVKVIVEQKGFRTKELVVVTTLLDPEQFPADQIAVLYRRRWQAELHLRSLKIVLQMDHLRCKTPHRARNEFFMHLVGYNLIRQLLRGGGIPLRCGTVDRKLQGSAANNHESIAAVEHAYRDPMLVRCAARCHRHSRHRQPPRPVRATGEKTPPQELQAHVRTARELQKANGGIMLEKFKCHSLLTPASICFCILARNHKLTSIGHLVCPQRIANKVGNYDALA